MAYLCFPAAIITAATLLAGAASAATVVSGNVCEFDGNPTPFGGTCDYSSKDYNTSVSADSFTLAGETSFYGYVAHVKNKGYSDGWTVDFGAKSYQVDFNWQAITQNFDGILNVQEVSNGTTSALSFSTANGPTGSFDLGRLNGVWTFDFNPVAGVFSGNPREEGNWDLQVAAVPLPAAGVLLLAAFAGLGAMGARRRTEAAA
ncbi:hypothetical protein JANAI62_04290 [Jannaschia pagri]|uniref:VPLPA-CTERM protein sorting domain-containing protein n=1 Tax=Jannaschia pagri TaxID=2829797 RepID=A0ABQ4NHC1_9RHOB|nr:MULTISPECIES: VPLPA-CTERM sorting domain-containing protein [unclassified Jannaschia]GIT90088.1 hypothetical protein JANAI61_05460 [Jannaschia sp. AI_61]GIT93806.1 hypothetical protein JANAI62_04290 [Jannaschia sp. AI_62]